MLQSKKFASHEDIEKKEREIEALLKKVLRDPIGDYKEEREKLERSFKKIQEIATKFGDRLDAVPETVQITVKKLQKDIEASLEGNVEDLEEKVNSLVAEKTIQFSNSHEAMEAKIQVLFEALQRDFCKLAEQGQQKQSEFLASFNQYAQSIKDLSSQVTHEVENIPGVAAQRFKKVIDESLLYLKSLNSRHIDHMEETNRQTALIQEKIIQEALDKQVKIVTSSSEVLQNSFISLKDNGELILSMLKSLELNIDKEIATLRNELSDVHRNALSNKMVLMVLLIITLFVTCGNGILEVLKLFQH